MSLLISRTRGLVSLLAAAVLILVPLNVSAANAEGLGTDTSLSVFTVNGTQVTDNQTVTLEPHTSSVVVVAEPSDPAATYTISGGTDLADGDNPLTVSVTAADGTTKEDHTVNLFVTPISSDASLKTLTVNGNPAVDGEDIYLDPFTDHVTYVAEANAMDSTVVVTGGTDLIAGLNELVVTVTAADGTIATYTVNLIVLLNTDTSLVTFQVNSTDVVDGSLVELDAKTSEVDVLVETTDPEATYEITGDTDLIAGYNELVVTVTAADGETTNEYFVTLNVAFNSDTNVESITVDGLYVVDGESIDLAPGTSTVAVQVSTSDPDASYEVAGDADLVAGENVLVITVTAADQTTTAEYTITLNVLRNDDTSLATFMVNGNDVADGDIVELEPNTPSVDVFIETTDELATVEITGDQDLLVGENELVVTVTASDGTTIDSYTVILKVLANTDTTAEITVDGEVSVDGDVHVFEWGTESVEVEVLTNDPEATFAINGDSALVTGENELSIIITAADGETYETVTITLVVLPNTDTSLSTFQVNGTDVLDGDSVDTEPAASSVEILVETTDPDATYEIYGDTDLVVGSNELVVTVIAADGETVQDYTIFINVPMNDDATASSIMVNGDSVDDGDSLDLDPYTDNVDVMVETTDPDATFEIEGDNGLVVGENTLIVTITAADGETTQAYEITLVVALGNDTSLATFQVNGEDVEDDAVVVLAPKTTSVDVTVETTDPEATFEITGGEDLTEGANDLVVLVTAQNGVDFMEHVVTLEVPLSDDATVTSIVVNGSDVVDGDTIVLPANTTEVDVEVATTDEDADVQIIGDLGLVAGENDLAIIVTAADGETVIENHITLIVPLNDDVSLATFQVDGNDVLDGDVIELESNVTEVGVVVETTDPDATYEVSGDTELISGDNTLIVSVTAADGVTVFEYTITLVVADGSNLDLSVLTVDGANVEDGDVLDLAPGTTDVEVVVETEDPNATVSYVGDSGLEAGENALIINVVSANGQETAEIIIVLNVLLGIDTSLATFTVDGNDVADGDVVDLEPGTTEVDVEVETTDPNATFELTGELGLVPGENTLTVTVTAEDGVTVQDYFVTLMLPANNNTELALFEINWSEVNDGETVDLAARTTEVRIDVETVDPEATFEIEGGTDLILGENTLIIHVTAADGSTTQDYTVTLMVPSDDASVTSIVVGGVVSVSGDIITIAPDSESVDVEVNTRDENATYLVKGADALVLGDNEVVVTVIAQDGTTEDYRFTVRVGGQSADTTLTTLTINGADVADGAVLNLPSRTTSVNLVATPRDPAATVKVTGRTNMVVGKNVIEIVVTAPDLKTVRYIFITANVAPLSGNTDLAQFTINGITATDKGTVELAPLTRNLTVIAKTADVEAVAVVSGKSVVDGNNTLTVAVTAANGTVRTYTVTVVVRLIGTDNTLKTFTINGTDATTLTSYTTEPAATSIQLVALTNDVRATAVISGATGLRVGDNAVSVLVTAENGATKTYKLTVKVPASNNTALKSLQINGVETAAGSKVTLPRGTKAVTAKALGVDAEAKVAITGGSALVNGDNTLTVTVTAADLVATKSYTVNLFVTPPSSDATLKTFKVNGVTTADLGTVIVPALTTSVMVEASANDPEAVVVVTGKSGLVEGNNPLKVTVTAADGTVKVYNVNIGVLSLSSDNSLKSLKVNGTNYTTGDVNVPFGTKAVTIDAVVNDISASVSISGNGALRTGSNTITVRVTAANGAIADKTISVVVAKSSNTTLTTLTVNGLGALSGGTVNLPARTTLAVVKAVTADPETTVAVTGTALKDGNNTVTVTVTAADLTSRVIEIPVYVTPLSSNTGLSVFKVNDISVIDGATINVANRTLSVPVVATPADVEAIATISGAGALRTGNNTVTVTVVAANGTKKVYTVTVVVAKSSNTTLTSLTVNGISALGGVTVNQPVRTSLAVVKAVTADPETTVAVTGTALKEGSNTVTVTITAPDASVRVVEIPVYVTPLSSNTSLSSFKVNDVTVADGASINVANKTASVTVVATAADADAVVSVAGNTALRTGSNTVSVTVVAANLTKKVYTVTVVVAKSSNTALSSLSVNGNAVAEGGTSTLPARTVSAVIKAVTTDPEAKVAITGGSSLVSGNNAASVTVTAADGTTKKYDFTIYVTPLSSDNSLKSLTVNGAAYVADSTVNLALGSTAVAVVAVANDAGAKVEITGNTALVGGLNNITIKITAANGDVRNVTAKVSVPVRSSNAEISVEAGTWTINGTDVTSASTVVELTAGVTAVTAVAKPQDAKATLLITGTTGLVTGDNTVSFKVTAEDGTTTKTFTRTVKVKALSSNTNLTSLSVAGNTVVDGDTVNVAAGTGRVSVLPVLESDEARFTITGNTGLATGENLVKVEVTAPSGAKATTTIKVVVAAPPMDTSLSTFTVNGTAVVDGSVINVAAGTTRLHVSAIATDAQASVAITGKSDLVAGVNHLVVTVTALSGDKSTYTVTVNVGN